MCCDSWDRKESDRNERLNRTEDIKIDSTVVNRKITIFRFLFFSFHLSVSICLPGSPESKPNFITLIFCSQRSQFSIPQVPW